MKIAFFDTKAYDKPSFEHYGREQGMEFTFFETKLNETTAELAHGYDAVCAFVNDTVDAKVIDILVANGVKVLAMRCAGYNNVDLAYEPFPRIPVNEDCVLLMSADSDISGRATVRVYYYYRSV